MRSSHGAALAVDRQAQGGGRQPGATGVLNPVPPAPTPLLEAWVLVAGINSASSAAVHAQVWASLQVYTQKPEAGKPSEAPLSLPVAPCGMRPSEAGCAVRGTRRVQSVRGEGRGVSD